MATAWKKSRQERALKLHEKNLKILKERHLNTKDKDQAKALLSKISKQEEVIQNLKMNLGQMPRPKKPTEEESKALTEEVLGISS